MRLAVEVDKAKREELQELKDEIKELKDEKEQMDEELDDVITHAPVSSLSEIPSYIDELQGEKEELEEEKDELHLENIKLTEKIASVQPSALQEENEKLKAQMVTITRGLREGFACITALKEENEKLVWKR
jgi:predicted nuclease with TOPRIM domain